MTLRPLLKRSVLTFFSMIVPIVVGCGDSGKDEKDQDEVLIYSVEFAPAIYYSFISDCGRDSRNVEELSYNAKGILIREKNCAFDAAAMTQTVTEKRIEGDLLEIDSYSELVFNASDQLTNANEWEDIGKAKVRREYVFTYNPDGKLTQSVETSDDGKKITTTEFDAKQSPAKETTVDSSGIVPSTKVSTCASIFTSEYRPCNVKKNDAVIETLTQEGEEFVRKQLVKEELTEVERFSFLKDFQYKSRSYKSYDFDGTIRYESKETCSEDGDLINCTEVSTTSKGVEFQTETSQFKNFGTVKIKVGDDERTSVAYVEVAGSFSVKEKDKEMSGTLSSAFDSGTFDIDSKITFELKEASNPELGSVYSLTPYWLQTSGDLEDILPSEAKSGKFQLNSITRNDANKREILNDTTGLIGLTLEEVNPNFVYKKETIYK